MKKIFLYNAILAIFFPMLVPASFAHAAKLSAVQSSNASGLLTLSVMLDNEGASFNVSGGTLVYPGDLVSVEAITTVDSVLNLWIDRPHDADGEIAWSGVVPGGFSGVRDIEAGTTVPGRLFQVTFRAKDAGTAAFSFIDAILYMNDAVSTPVIPKLASLQVAVAPGDGTLPAEAAVSDFDARLIATIERDESIEGGKWFAVFTVDTTRVSVDHYEVAESSKKDPATIRPSQWTRTESPYVLKHQSRGRYVHVKAVASNGSLYVTTIDPLVHSMFASMHVVLWSILMALVLFVILKKRKVVSQFLKNITSR